MAYLDPNIPLRVPQQPTFAEQAGQAFQLADVVEKQKAMQAQKQDSANLQQYLKEGGNLDTPEGIAKAAEWGRQNISPSGYKTIVSAGQEMRTNEQKRIEALSKAEGAQLDNMIKRGEVIGQSVAPVLSKYAERKTEVGEQQATEEFKTGLQPVLQNMVQQRLITPQQAQQYADASPAQVESVLQSTNYGRKMVLEAAKLKQIQAGTEADIALKAEREARTAEIKKGRPARAAARGGAGSGESGGMLSPQAADDAAMRYNMFTELPPLGGGTAGRVQRAQILNRAAEQLREQGKDSQAGLMDAKANKAMVSALSGVEKNRGMILTFEETARKNADIVTELSSKVDRTGVPVINRWLLAGREKIAGDTDVSNFNLAVQTFINEYARVTNSSTGGGITTDTARKEIEDRLNSAMTKEQILGVVNTAKREMENRRQSYDNMAEDMRQRIKGISAKPAAAPAAGTPAAAKTAPQGAIDLLKQNPQFKEQFRKKYGYVPEGM